jgi:hypothetical protein
MEATVAEALFRDARAVHVDDDAGVLTRLFADELIGVVVDDDHHLRGVVTEPDPVDYLTSSLETAGGWNLLGGLC